MPEDSQPVSEIDSPSKPSFFDRSVPNPLAKNPNVHTHKVFATVGLILIGTIVAVAGAWWYVENQTGGKTTEEESTTKISTSSAKTKVDTSDWKVFTSTKWGFTVKYPKDWGSATETDTGARFLKNEQEYGGPIITFDWNEDASRTLLYNRINSYKVNETINFETDFWIQESTTSAKTFIKDKYVRLNDGKVDGNKALRYTVDYGYKDVGYNDSYNVLIVKNNKIYKVGIDTFDLKLQESIIELDQILSTFKFL